MKKSKIILPIINIILIFMPLQINAWIQNSTYEACNIVNKCISYLLKIIILVISIKYITGVVQYIKSATEDKNQQIKKILTWLIIVIVEIAFFSAGSLWVKEIGMEKYWSTGERYQFNEIDGYITYTIRIIALILIIIYMISAIIYFIKSKNEKIIKIEKIVKWQMITSAIVAGLLIFATRW